MYKYTSYMRRSFTLYSLYDHDQPLYQQIKDERREVGESVVREDHLKVVDVVVWLVCQITSEIKSYHLHLKKTTTRKCPHNK